MNIERSFSLRCFETYSPAYSCIYFYLFCQQYNAVLLDYSLYMIICLIQHYVRFAFKYQKVACLIQCT